MWPTLISIGPLAIHSFGVFLALGVFFGGFVFWQRGKQEGVKEEELMDGWLISGLAALIISRGWWILSHWSEFNSWYRIIYLTKFPGLSYEAAWLGFWLGLTIWILKKQWSVWTVLEAACFSQLTVEVFAWIGSFLAGSNLGAVTNWLWGLSFPGVEGRRQPVHLVLIIGLILLISLMKKLEKQYRGFGASPGFLVGVYLTGIGCLRLINSALINNSFVLGVIFSLAGVLLLLERWGKLAKLTSAAVKKDKSAGFIKKPSSQPKRKKQGFDFYVKN